MANQNELQRLEEIKIKRLEFCKEHGINPRKIMIASRELITKGRVNSTINTNKMKKWTNKELWVAIGTLQYMFQEIYNLSPEQVDALWPTKKDAERMFLEETVTKSLVNKICEEAPKDVIKNCLFNNKKIILKMIFPEYYDQTYSHYDILEDVINAKQDTLFDLRMAGKYKGTVKSNKNNNKGKLVDEIILEGIEANFNIREKIYNYPDKLLFLSQAKVNHFKDLGFMKIIQGRGFYSSALDFYYMNSPKELQKRYFEYYKTLRGESQKKDAITEIMNNILNKIDTRDELCLS